MTEQPALEIRTLRRHLRRVLVVSHVGDNRHKNGGSVYTRSLLELIKMGCPSVEIDLRFFTGQVAPIVRQWRQAKALMRATFAHWPSKALYFQSQAFADQLVAQLGIGSYDLVVLDHAEMLWCREHIPSGIPVVAVAHNIESRIYEQFLAHRPISRRILRRDLLKYQRFELEQLSRVGSVVAISSHDATALRQAIPGVEIIVVPPTFSYAPANRSPHVRQPLRVGLLGNFDWWPNRDAYRWFVEEVWQHLEGDSELHVFGPYSTALPRATRTMLHGFLDNINDVWNGVDLMVNPIVSGSGVNVKVAEAIYNGLPMLCTPTAVAGLLESPDPAIVILERPEDWRRVLGGNDAVALAHRSPQLSTRMHVEARTHAERLAAFLDGVIARSGPQRTVTKR